MTRNDEVNALTVRRNSWNLSNWDSDFFEVFIDPVIDAMAEVIFAELEELYPGQCDLRPKVLLDS